MLRNLVTSLLKHERIRTTVAKAKEARRYAEKMITIAKKDNLAAKRRVLGFVRERDVASKLFKTLIYRYAERKGGYTRILKLGSRPGDGAEMAFLELVDRPVQAEAAPTDKKEKASKGTPDEAGAGKTAKDGKAKKEKTATKA
jgi:large subunit ribosomal protein L17